MATNGRRVEITFRQDDGVERSIPGHNIEDLTDEEADVLFRFLLPLLLKRDGAIISAPDDTEYRLGCWRYAHSGLER
jgi:hypothetical protein